MMNTLQETDSQAVPAPQERKFAFVAQSPSGTSSWNIVERYSPIQSPYHQLARTMNVVEKLGRNSIGVQAADLIVALQRVLANMQRYRFNTHHIPALNVQQPDDGSLLFEWTLPNLRLGFSIEEDNSQSSWYLVTNATLGNIGGSGYLPGGNLQNLLEWLVSFLAAQCRVWNMPTTASGESLMTPRGILNDS
jgi:hypothetical protein